MVWGGIWKSGKIKLRFIKPGVKVNVQYYIDEILKPFKKDDLKELYLNRDGILQDSALSHASRKTIDFLTKENIRSIQPVLWTPSSPDNAPLDHSIWHYMEVKLKKSWDSSRAKACSHGYLEQNASKYRVSHGNITDFKPL